MPGDAVAAAEGTVEYVYVQAGGETAMQCKRNRESRR